MWGFWVGPTLGFVHPRLPHMSKTRGEDFDARRNDAGEKKTLGIQFRCNFSGWGGRMCSTHGIRSISSSHVCLLFKSIVFDCGNESALVCVSPRISCFGVWASFSSFVFLISSLFERGSGLNVSNPNRTTNDRRILDVDASKREPVRYGIFAKDSI